jgi:hypothetical protein
MIMVIMFVTYCFTVHFCIKYLDDDKLVRSDFDQIVKNFRYIAIILIFLLTIKFFNFL